jgi:NADH:ubiquinone oxidoreductase subunit F (NADH-binding)
VTSVLQARAGDRFPAPPEGVPRLLSGLTGAAPGLAPHLERWGMTPSMSAMQLLAEVEASGLGGHGGAWFPVARKWRAVASAGRRRPVVVANGAEGEPASMKDAVLLTRAPHLVLDGAATAAAAVGAARVVVYVHRRHAGVVHAAIDERRRARLDRAEFDVALAPDAFLAGQESAVVNVVNGRADPVPSFVTIRSVRERGVENRPTLVQNVETLAHVALIARYGATWFRGVGTGAGTMLLTVHGAWGEPTVVEAPLGSSLWDVLRLDRVPATSWHGALLGGYGGGWVSMDTLRRLPLIEAAARHSGTTLGAGVVALLPRQACPVAEVARVAAYMRDQSAGQCGPCVNGLADLSMLLHEVAYGRPRSHGRSGSAPGGGNVVRRLMDLSALVEGRGACKHPDGVARMVRSACDVFGDHLAAHVAHGPCPEAARSVVLPIPEGRRTWVR